MQHHRHVRIKHGTIGHPKFTGPATEPAPLTAAEWGTWTVALLMSDIAYPGPIHESAVRLMAPGATFERLYERNLLEPCDDPGWFYVHDMAQYHTKPSQEPEAVAERVRRHRAAVTRETPVTRETRETPDETIRDDTSDSESVSKAVTSRARSREAGPGRGGLRQAMA